MFVIAHDILGPTQFVHPMVVACQGMYAGHDIVAYSTAQFEKLAHTMPSVAALGHLKKAGYTLLPGPAMLIENLGYFMSEITGRIRDSDSEEAKKLLLSGKPIDCRWYVARVRGAGETLEKQEQPASILLSLWTLLIYPPQPVYSIVRGIMMPTPAYRLFVPSDTSVDLGFVRGSKKKLVANIIVSNRETAGSFVAELTRFSEERIEGKRLVQITTRPMASI